MYTLMVETRFASAHQLRGYKGKCENLHGHSWKVQVFVTTDSLNHISLAMDFTDLKRIAAEIVDPLDHACLELLRDWSRNAAARGCALVVDWKELDRRVEGQRAA